MPGVNITHPDQIIPIYDISNSGKTQDELKPIKIYDVKSDIKIDSNNHGLKKDSFVRNGKEVTSYRNSSGHFAKKPSFYKYSINTQIPLINLGGQEYSREIIDIRELTLGGTKIQTGMIAYAKAPYISSGFSNGINAITGWQSGVLVGNAKFDDGNLSINILETSGGAGCNVDKSGLGAKAGFKISLANIKYSRPIKEKCFMNYCFQGGVTFEAGIGINAKAEIGLSNKKNKATLGVGEGLYGEVSSQGSFSFNEQYIIERHKNLEQIQAEYDHFNTEIKKYHPHVIAKISMMDLFDFGNHEDFDSILILAETYRKR